LSGDPGKTNTSDESDDACKMYLLNYAPLRVIRVIRVVRISRLIGYSGYYGY
jgi:hypothetical protein